MGILACCAGRDQLEALHIRLTEITTLKDTYNWLVEFHNQLTDDHTLLTDKDGKTEDEKNILKMLGDLKTAVESDKTSLKAKVDTKDVKVSVLIGYLRELFEKVTAKNDKGGRVYKFTASADIKKCSDAIHAEITNLTTEKKVTNV